MREDRPEVMQSHELPHILYYTIPIRIAPSRNIFQNLKEGSDLWFDVSNKYYTAYLSDADAVSDPAIPTAPSSRSHTGVIDSDYITHTGDPTYQVGQRLVIREAAVRQC